MSEQTKTIKATVRYDGAPFAGWQVQPDAHTVQGELETALNTIAGAFVRIHGAGRTDAGVHALGQVFSCSVPVSIDLRRLRRSLSKMLGPSIRVESIEPVPDTFHARKSAVGKHYAYTIGLAKEPDPFWAGHAWCVPWPLDMDCLRRLASTIEGEHDFAGFQSSGTGVKTTVRTVYRIQLNQGGVVAPCDTNVLWRIDFYGNGFLYKMVRNLVGTMIDIARGKLPDSTLDERMNAQGPFMGHTAPAHGLALVSVDYDEP